MGEKLNLNVDFNGGFMPFAVVAGYILVVIVLNVIPLGGFGVLNRTDIGPFRADHLLHAIVFLPWMFLLFFVPQGGERVGRIWMWLGWLGLGVIIAVGVEVMQLWVPHRAFSPMDGVFGVVGVVVGGGLVLLRRVIR